MHFATIEAGLIAQLLETFAAGTGIGVCNVGSLEFDRIRKLFHLETSHVLIHSMLGGATESAMSTLTEPAPGADEGARVARMAERIRKLSPEDVKALLDASGNREGDEGDS